MAPRDFLNERRIVVHNGRRFSVRKPTVETVLRLTMNFGIELASIHKSWLGSGGLGADPVSVILPFLHRSNPQALAETIASFVDMSEDHDGQTQELIEGSPELRGLVVRAALTICNPARIAKEMNLDKISEAVSGLGKEDEDDATTGGPSPVEVGIAVIADHYKGAGLTPFDVMRWPYEAMLSLLDEILPFLNTGIARGRTEQDAEFGSMPSRGRAVTAWAPGSFGTAYATGTIKATEN